jgi:hypothetical protein
MRALCVYDACMANTPEPAEWTNVRLPRDLADRLRALAAENDRSLSAELRQAVRSHLDGATFLGHTDATPKGNR